MTGARNGPRAAVLRSYDEARVRYRPNRIQILFVAEAPPANASRFFYFENVRSHDWLFLAVMRWQYGDARNLDLDELRESKPRFLAQFRDDGCYLVDAIETAMPKQSSSSVKKRLLARGLSRLIERLRNLATDDTKIVLVSSRVFRACYQPLRDAGLNVINTESIDFPSNGRQKVFARKLGQLLDVDLRNAISALEDTVRSYGPGKANHKAHEFYVAEHFLKGVGLRFEAGEIEQPDVDPPDVKFRGALFEIKEIQDEGRRRHDEYRKRLEKARQAERYADLVEPFSPVDLRVDAVFRRVLSETARLTKKYRQEVRRDLDLLFYVNLQRTMGLDDGPRPDVSSLQSEGWRSVSFLSGARTCCVMFATERAPFFLTAVRGRLLSALAFD